MTTTTFNPISTTNKFQRTYQILIQSQNGSTFTLGSPDGSKPLLTLEFNIQRNAMATAQSANIKIKNVNQGTREAISKNFWTPVLYGSNGLPLWQSVVLQAGYVGTPLATIFNGKANTIMSYREEGGTEWITEIDGTDFQGLFSTCFSNWSENTGTGQAYTQQNVITNLVNDLQKCATNNQSALGIGCVNGFFAPRYSFTANDFTMNLLNIETSRLAYIDNGKIYAMPSNYVFTGDITLISSQTGLIGSPKVQQNYLIAQMIFEPGIQPGQQIFLDTELSEFSSLKNGAYKVVGVQHAGVISSTVGGKCITTVTMQYIPDAQIVLPGLYVSQ